MTALSIEQLLENSASTVISAGVSAGHPIAGIGRIQANCPKHGVYFCTGQRLARRDVWTTCQACSADSYRSDLDASRMAREQIATKDHLHRLTLAAIPARFMNRTLDNFRAATPDQNHALAAARNFALNWEESRRKGEWMVFSGPPGTGKSHLAIAVLQAIMPGSVGRYMTCMELIQTLRATWRKDSELSETALLEALTKIPLLVLDEIGVQYGTESEQHHLFDVLDRRYREMQPTILLTNQNKDGFRQFVGDRVHDRLKEVARWVPFDWESHRKQARKDFA